ncbi:hypothetical protein FRP1_29595 (plasmid) [Pseudonocardia sp. EC080625-04]|uniref:ROK family protein n=1 Tax=unclassified Pseudonocardia TaxID=2619320 RepID=UPI0006CB7B96|nr:MULTISPECIES: ROK family protein [unclassified Pseudonocardia]ALE76909.1 hypothetical protein FRP1_29595 [Pseudonocardia sp. EC080625-04]ALL85888.1 hypothetical protein AD017_32800 [Pseudonocardia sp. EC080619-01]
MSVLALDIGGSKVAVRADGREPYAAVVRWAEGADLAQDLSLLRTTLLAAVWATGRPEALGVAFPATVNRRGTVTSWPNRPHWVGMDWRAFLDELLPPDVPARSADDGDLAALAEAEHAGLADIVYLGVGTGIGGGIVLDGRPVPGAGRGSCEIGHMIVDTAGDKCECGRHGCLQATASGSAVLRRAGVLRGGPVDFACLERGWVDGENWAVTAVRAGCVALAAGAVSIAEMVCSDVTVIGGGFAQLPGFVEVVAEHVELLQRDGHALPEVQRSTLNGASSLQGALLLAGEARTATTAPRWS